MATPPHDPGQVEPMKQPGRGRGWMPLVAALATVLVLALLWGAVHLLRSQTQEPGPEGDVGIEQRDAGDASAPAQRPGGEGSLAKIRHYGPEWTPKGLEALPPVPEGAFSDQDFIQGAALGLYFELPELSYAQLFAEIKELGATHVSLVVAWSMRDIRAVQVRPHETETVPDEKVRRYIQQAHAAGLKVMLFPILHVERRRSGEWRGKLAPRDPARWWGEYRAFVLHYAGLAQEEGVEIYSVGSELLSMEHEETRWRGLIKDTRGVFKGRLTYSANWDHFDHVSFWSALDIAGMTGYFELSNEEQPALEELRQVWEGATEVISTYPERAAGKPVILTEVGYPSQKGGAAHPWNYTMRKEPDVHGQYLAFRAMYEAWRQRALRQQKGEVDQLGLGGMFIWNWYGYGGDRDGSYTLRGKPAEAVIRRWYQGRAPEAP